MSLLMCRFYEHGHRCDKTALLFDGYRWYCAQHHFTMPEHSEYHRLRQEFIRASPEVADATIAAQNTYDFASEAEREYAQLNAAYRTGDRFVTEEIVLAAYQMHASAASECKRAAIHKAQTIWDARERMNPGVNAAEYAARRDDWARRLAMSKF